MKTLAPPFALGFAFALGCAGLSPPAPAPLTSTPAGRRPVDGDLLALVPAPAETVLWVDVAQLRASAWTRRALSLATSEERVARGRVRGFDEIEDVDRMLIASLPAADGRAVSLEILKGRFDRGRLREAFRQRNPSARLSSYRDAELLESPASSLVFLADDTLATGPLSALRAAVDAAAGRGRSVRDEPWLVQVRTALEDESGPSEAAAALELALLVTERTRAELREGIGDADALERLGARLELGQTAHLAAVGITRSRVEAVDLAARLDGEVQALRDRRSVVALGLGPVVESLRVSARGSRVFLGAAVSERDRDLVSERVAALAELLAKSRQSDSAGGTREGARSEPETAEHHRAIP
jgi:hypothetical protein